MRTILCFLSSCRAHVAGMGRTTTATSVTRLMEDVSSQTVRLGRQISVRLVFSCAIGVQANETRKIVTMHQTGTNAMSQRQTDAVSVPLKMRRYWSSREILATVLDTLNIISLASSSSGDVSIAVSTHGPTWQDGLSYL
jgi:ABC-type glutathione transport system ATPase component